MSPHANSVLHDYLHALVAEMEVLGMQWSATGFVPSDASYTFMSDRTARIRATGKSRAGVYKGVIALCERRVIDAYATMANVWPPGIITFWPTAAHSVWKHGDDVLGSCVRWLIEVDGAVAVLGKLSVPLLRALDAETPAVLAFGDMRGMGGKLLPTRDALLALEDSREAEVKQEAASALSVGDPDPVIDAGELDRIATDAGRVRDEMPPPQRTAPDPRRERAGFARAFYKSTEEHADVAAAANAAYGTAIEDAYAGDASSDNIERVLDKYMAKFDALCASRNASAVEAAMKAAVEAAVATATAEHNARVREMRAELATMRGFETQVLKDNNRLRAENALLLGTVMVEDPEVAMARSAAGGFRRDSA